MKNILSLYKNLFTTNLLAWESSWSNEKKTEISLNDAQKIVDRYKDFADFYENSDTAKLTSSNRLRYQEYKNALNIINSQNQPLEKSIDLEVEKIDVKEISWAINYNSRLNDIALSDIKYVLWLDKDALVDEKFIYLVRNFQKLKWLEVDGKVWPNTLKEFLKSASTVYKNTDSAKRLSIESVKSNFELNSSSIINKLNSWEDISQKEKTDLDKAISLAEKQISEINIVWESLDLNKQKLISDFKNELNQFKKLTQTEIKYSNVETKEEFSSWKSEFLWFISRWDFSTREFLNSLPVDSRVSLEKILKSSNLEEIYNSLVSVSPKNEKGNNYFLDYLIWENYSDFIKEVKKLWYKQDWLFDDKEAVKVLSVIWDYVKNQNNVPSLSDSQKVELLLDFDKNGNLTVDKNFVVWELQSLNALKWLNSDWVNALMDNLWLGTIAEFSSQMQSNLFNAREKFQRTLSTLVNSWVSIAELTQKKWVEKSFENMLANEAKILENINSEIDNSNKLEAKLSTLPEWVNKDEIKKILKLEAAAWVINWSKIWAWVSFDIKDYTAKIIDSVQFWIYDSKPWIAITKEVYSSDNVNIKASLVNIVIPVLSGSYNFDLKNDHNWLFNNELDSKYSPTIYGSASLNWLAAWVHFSKVDHSTKAWIDHMVNETSKALTLIKDDLLAGKNFQESQYYEKSQNKELDMIVYNELKAVSDKFAWTPEHKQVVEVILRWYKEFYENNLYQNAKWINFSWAWVGIALIKWYLPLPYLTLSFDKLSIDFNTVNYRLEWQREVTSKLLDLSKVGLKYEDLDGKNVYSIVDNWNIEFSSDTWNVEVLRKDQKVYFSGENIKSVKFEEYFGQESSKLVVVINWWKTWEKWEYSKSNEVDIVTSQKENIFNSLVLDSAKIRELNMETINSTLEIRSNLFNIISKDAISSPNTPWMTKLQEMIYNMTINSWVTLNQAWTQFESVVNNPKFIEYAKQKNWLESLTLLKIQLNSNLNDAQKLMILQSIPACLMKLKALKINDWTVNVWKSINDFETRISYFDRIFSNEAWDILPEVQKARKDWLKANWDKTSYNFTKIWDWDIAFSWTNIKSWNKNILMPYMWSFNVADAWTPEIEILKKSKDLIDRLPNEYLDLIKDNLAQKWVNISSNENLKALLKWEEINWIRLDYKQYFVKMWECLNDAIVLKNINVVWVSEISSTSSANIAQKDNVKLWLAVSSEAEKRDSGKTGPDSEPWIEETEWPDSEPWIEWAWWASWGVDSSWEWDFN